MGAFLFIKPSMRQYDADELMIAHRKRASRQRPPAGELIQGVFFALFTAREYFAAAHLLFSNGKTFPAFGHLINGLEELGKINKIGPLIVNWKEPEKVQEYLSKQKNHPWKLAGALSIFTSIISRKGTSFKIISVLAESLEKQDPVDFLLNYISPEAATYYHQTRLELNYTNFNGREFQSPYHNLSKIDPELCNQISLMLGDTIDKVLELVGRAAPVILEPIRQCYKATNHDEIKALKKEINRRVERILPAVRMYLDNLLIEKHGIGLDDLVDDPNKVDLSTTIDQKEVSFHHKRICDIIEGNQKIDLIYIYPPLKQSAKQYYLKQEQNP